jgi:hypothetical protein
MFGIFHPRYPPGMRAAQVLKSMLTESYFSTLPFLQIRLISPEIASGEGFGFETDENTTQQTKFILLVIS